MDVLLVLVSVVLGTVLSSALSILPGLHIYNVMGLLIMLLMWVEGFGHVVPTEVYLPFMMGMIYLRGIRPENSSQVWRI